MGSWEDVKVKIQSLWYDFWNAVGQVLNWIGQVITWIVTSLVPAILIVVGGLIGVTTILAIFSPLVATAFAQAVVTIVVESVQLAAIIVGGAFDFAVAAIDATLTGFATLLEAIDFEAILEVHQILWILSDDYRALIGQLFDKISEVSETLFGNTMILHLIFRNARSLVLSASSMLGRPYDIAQATWLSTFDDILVKFNEKAETYMEDPEQLFIDLEEWADKNAIDTGGYFRQGELSAMKLSLEGVKRIALDLKSVDDDYRAFKFALPGDRNRAISERVDPIDARLGAFNFSTYERHRFESNAMIEENRQNQMRDRERISNIEWQSDRPSRSLEKIDELPDADKGAEEVAMEEYSSRELGKDTEELVTQHDELIEKEESAKVREEVKLPPPSWEAIKETTVSKLAMSKSKSRTSPFVGDY